MLETSPRWTFQARYGLTDWYEHVHLLPERVLGQWCCVDRATGKRLWDRRYFRPNAVKGVGDGVIAASEWRSDGPWTDQFGCYGISLETGRLLWTSHGRGVWGGLARMLDFVPGFTNEFRDSPSHVQENEVICESGRVLDIRTGRDVRRIPQEEVEAARAARQKTPADQLFREDQVELPGGQRLAKRARDRRPAAPALQDDLSLILSHRGAELWHFGSSSTGYQLDGNFYSYRLQQRYVYLVMSEEVQWVPVSPSQPYCVQANPTIYRLLTLDLASGTIVQDFPVASDKLERCRIEDVDEQGLLVSSGRQLRYFARVAK